MSFFARMLASVIRLQKGSAKAARMARRRNSRTRRVGPSTGTTTIDAGIFQVTGGDAIVDTAAVTLAGVAGAEFELLMNETIGSLTGSGGAGGDVNLNGNTLGEGHGRPRMGF